MQRTPRGTALAVTVAVAVVTAVTVAVAGSGAAVANGTGAPTELDSCTTITEPGRYVLTQDVTNAEADTCIEIRASDVVVDGNGHLVDGVQDETGFEAFVTETAANGTFPSESRWDEHGVAANASGTLSNVTVTDLTVTDWFFGVYYGGVADAAVRNVTARNTGDGISAYRASNVSVVDSEVRETHGGGVVLDVVTDATVRGTTLTGNVDGALLNNVTGGTVADNVVTNNEDGFFLANVSELSVRNNEITGSYWTGIALLDSDGNAFSNNAITNTRGNVTFIQDTAAIVLLGSSENSFEDTTVSDNHANWTVYSANDSVDNTGTNLRVDGVSVSFTATDVAFRIDEAALGPGDGDAVVSTSTGATSSLQVSVTRVSTNATSDASSSSEGE